MPEKFELDESGDLSSLASQLEKMTAGEKTARIVNPGETANVPSELIMDDAKSIEDLTEPAPQAPPTVINRPMSKPATIILVSVVGVVIVGLALLLVRSLLGGSSSGQATVPKVIGRTLDEARVTLEQNRLRANVSYDPASRAPRGTVIAISPEAGTKVNPDTGVTLTIAGARPDAVPPAGSAQVTQPVTPGDPPKPGDPEQRPGPGPNPRPNPPVVTPTPGAEKAAVPDVEGMLEDKAKQKLTEAGFKVATEYGTDARLRDPVVLSVDPPAGAQLEMGQYIKIVVNKPSTSGAVTTLQTIALKNYTGRPASEVEAELRNLQLTPTIVAERSNLQQPGMVIKTVPPAGTAVAPGAKVTVLVAQ